MIGDIDAGERRGLHPGGVHGERDVLHGTISFGRFRFTDQPEAVIELGENELTLFVAGDDLHHFTVAGIDKAELHAGQVFPAGVHLDVP